MTEYARTAIRRLSIRGFRSIRSVDLTEIPDLVVLHGPNGAGKSNLLLAAQLALRAAIRPGSLPVGREHAFVLSLEQADTTLGLRPDDFHVDDLHMGVLPEIRVAIDVALGTRAAEIVRASQDQQFGRLTLDVIVQLTADDELRYWFERADLDGSFLLGTEADPAGQAVRQQLDNARDRVEKQRAVLGGQEAALAILDLKPPSPDIEAKRTKASIHVKRQLESLQAFENQMRQIEAQLDEPTLLADRIRRTLLPRLVQASPAYRVPGGKGDPEVALYRACLSNDRIERDAVRRLGRRLASAGLFSTGRFGEGADSVSLIPVNDTRYGERRILFTHPTHGDLPLRNLGSGEQQIVYMLAQRVITPFPIAHIEEPEAHLYTSLMEAFARVLRQSVAGDGGTPDVDQLWIATHHHLFALSEEFFDVSLDGAGSTQVEKRPREEAIEHFYEPHPYWETLRTLLEDGRLDPETILVEDESGPISAKDVLSSMHGDRRVANRYVAAATRALVLSLAQERRGK